MELIEVVSASNYGNRLVTEEVLNRLIAEGKAEWKRDIVPDAFNLGFKVVDKYFFK